MFFDLAVADLATYRFDKPGIARASAAGTAVGKIASKYRDLGKVHVK